jgi:hypothetical protein
MERKSTGKDAKDLPRGHQDIIKSDTAPTENALLQRLGKDVLFFIFGFLCVLKLHVIL